MENNQQSGNQNATSGSQSTSFSNDQPGQQLPTENNRHDLDKPSSESREQHSESSLPEKGNETLGTP